MSSALHRRLDRLDGDNHGDGFLVIWRNAGETDQQAAELWKAGHPGRAGDLERPGVKVCIVSWSIDRRDLQ